jgi:CBS domain-containing protein
MEKISVREVMVPLADYATVRQDATLYDVILTLEEAQSKFKRTGYRHRAVLVLDEAGHVVGKLSQMDIIEALQPDFTKKWNELNLSRFGISEASVKSLIRKRGFWNQPLSQLCSAAGRQNVKDVMYIPKEGEYIHSDASLRAAVHLLIIGHRHSLLVTEGDDVVGVLRLTDVFALISDAMKKAFEE